MCEHCGGTNIVNDCGRCGAPQCCYDCCARTTELMRLEVSMARMDAADPEEVDEELYSETLARIVELRKD